MRGTLGIATSLRKVLALPLLCMAIGAHAEELRARKVTDAAEIQRQTRDFEKSLGSLGVRAQLRCTHMVAVLPNAGRDTGYGAICEFKDAKSSRTVMLCDDIMIGKFTVKTSGFAVSDDEVVSFTKANCPPGG
jgi:hypothetical protein